MMQRYFPDNDPNHFHSSGYAQAAHGRTIGAASTQSYGQRLHVERNRQHVNRYGHSMLGRPIGDARPRGGMDEGGSVRTRLQTGDSRPVGAMSARPSGFREPPTRGYNPYQ